MAGQVMWDLWWTQCYWGRFSPSTSVSPATHHSAKFSILIITWVGAVGQLVAALTSAPSWTPPPLFGLNKIKKLNKYGYDAISQDSSAGVTTGWMVWARFPVGEKILSSPQRSDRLWGPISLLSNGYPGLFPGGKEAGE
jgi:hypothetical protein